MITVLATLKAAPGKEDELKSVLTNMVSNVKEKEKGAVLSYSLHQSDSDPTAFTFYETYRDADAFDAHGKTEHMAAMGANLRGLLAGRPEISRLTRIASID
jgi:quinol monooxygenase YgiN